MPAQTPSLPGPAAEDVRQPLAQPPLDALGGDDDELLGEWVGQRIGEQCAEAVGQQVGALGAVEVQMPSGVRLRTGPVAAFDESPQLARRPAELLDHPTVQPACVRPSRLS